MSNCFPITLITKLFCPRKPLNCTFATHKYYTYLLIWTIPLPFEECLNNRLSIYDILFHCIIRPFLFIIILYPKNIFWLQMTMINRKSILLSIKDKDHYKISFTLPRYDFMLFDTCRKHYPSMLRYQCSLEICNALFLKNSKTIHFQFGLSKMA